MIDAQLGNPIS